MEGRAQETEIALEIGHQGDPLIVEGVPIRTFGRGQAGTGPLRQCLGHVGAGVVRGTRPCDERITRAYLTAVDHQAANAQRLQPLQGLLHVLNPSHPRGHHQKLSSTAGTLATIWDFTSASGGTLSRRSV